MNSTIQSQNIFLTVQTSPGKADTKQALIKMLVTSKKTIFMMPLFSTQDLKEPNSNNFDFVTENFVVVLF